MAMRTMVDQNRVLHDVVVLLSWRTSDSATTPTGTRVEIAGLTSWDVAQDSSGSGVVSVDATFGYTEHIDPIRTLREAQADNQVSGRLHPASYLYFVSQPVPRCDSEGSLQRWRQVLFLAISRVVPGPVDLLELPRDRTIIIGHVIGLWNPAALGR